MSTAIQLKTNNFMSSDEDKNSAMRMAHGKSMVDGLKSARNRKSVKDVQFKGKHSSAN